MNKAKRLVASACVIVWLATLVSGCAIIKVFADQIVSEANNLSNATFTVAGFRLGMNENEANLLSGYVAN